VCGRARKTRRVRLATIGALMLRKDAKIEILQRVTLFAGCSKKELGQIALIADEIDFAPAKVLIKQGDPGRQFFVVIEGEVKVEKNGKKLPMIGGSEFYGEISLVSGSPATATVTTVTPTRALVITPAHFRGLLDRSPSIQRRVLHSFSERLAPHVI
jgi:CRP/FNR family transcriptional regulator, cyclic AMP receptor protein